MFYKITFPYLNFLFKIMHAIKKKLNKLHPHLNQDLGF